jgi:Rps23 Pro-64 3,4-dihydroxylase Tpa1-like proline 4-hydroxylase
MSSFTQSELKSIAVSCAERVAQAKHGEDYFDEPYRHLVLDDFLDKRLADMCLASFPPLDDGTWEHANDKDIEVKYRTAWTSEFDVPDGLIDTVRILNSSLFLNAMAARIGIAKIIPDPYFSGGGLNVTTRGGLLDVHVDGNYHDATGLNRRLNAILYLNPHWQPSWGGEFGIYDRTGDVCLKKVPPLFNRLVVFDSHDFSFHGLPDPVSFPEGEQRRSIILYYYTKEPRPPQQIAVDQPHSALWKKRDLHDKRGQKIRAFK